MATNTRVSRGVTSKKDMREDDFQEMLRIQQMMSQRLLQEQRTDRKIDVLNVINELSSNGKKRVQVEAVLIEAKYQGIAQQDVSRILDDLESDHLIIMQSGYIQKT